MDRPSALLVGDAEEAGLHCAEKKRKHYAPKSRGRGLRKRRCAQPRLPQRRYHRERKLPPPRACPGPEGSGRFGRVVFRVAGVHSHVFQVSAGLDNVVQGAAARTPPVPLRRACPPPHMYILKYF